MKHFVVILFICIPIVTFGQISDSNSVFRNSIQIELLGSGLVYSIGCERIIIHKAAFEIGAKIGLTYIPNILAENRNTTPTVGTIGEIDFLFGKTKTYLEVGCG